MWYINGKWFSGLCDKTYEVLHWLRSWRRPHNLQNYMVSILLKKWEFFPPQFLETELVRGTLDHWHSCAFDRSWNNGVFYELRKNKNKKPMHSSNILSSTEEAARNFLEQLGSCGCICQWRQLLTLWSSVLAGHCTTPALKHCSTLYIAMATERWDNFRV